MWCEITYLVTLFGVVLSGQGLWGSPLVLAVVPAGMWVAAVAFYGLPTGAFPQADTDQAGSAAALDGVQRLTYFHLVLHRPGVAAADATGQPWGLYFLVTVASADAHDVRPLHVSAAVRQHATRTGGADEYPYLFHVEALVASPCSRSVWTITCRTTSTRWCRTTGYARCMPSCWKRKSTADRPR